MNDDRLSVLHVMRPNQPEYFSIERVCAAVRQAAPANVTITSWTCPHPSKGLISRLRGALVVRCLESDVFHVTGDAHYLTYFLPRKKTVLTVHDCGFIEQRKGIRRWLLWFFWLYLPEKRTARIVAVSHETRRRLLTHIGCNAEKVVVIENPVCAEFDGAERKFNEVRPRVLQVGTNANKNVEGVAQALEGLNVELRIIGFLEESQRRALEDLGLTYRELGRLSNDEVANEYYSCDVVAFCSTHEGFGLPIIEAQAAGRPVVTSKYSPMCDVAGKGACLVDPASVEEIRRGLVRVLNDRTYRARLTKLGLENARRFDATRIASKYANLYREVAGCAKRRI